MEYLVKVVISLIIIAFGSGVIVLSKIITEIFFCKVRYGYKILDKYMYIKEFRKMICLLGISYIIFAIFMWYGYGVSFLFIFIQGLIMIICIKKRNKYIKYYSGKS